MVVDMAMEYVQDYGPTVSGLTATAVGVSHFAQQNVLGFIPGEGLGAIVGFGAITAAGAGTLYHKHLA